MRTACAVLTLVGAVLIANSAAAAEKNEKKNVAIRYFQTVDQYLKPVTLTEDQKSKLAALKKDYEPKFKEVYAKQNVLTPEQKKAGDDAKKAAQAEGKKGKELNAAFDAAAKATDDQKAKKKEADKQLRDLEKEMHGKIVDLLTPAQKDQIKAAKPKSDKPAPAAATK